MTSFSTGLFESRGLLLVMKSPSSSFLLLVVLWSCPQETVGVGPFRGREQAAATLGLRAGTPCPDVGRGSSGPHTCADVPSRPPLPEINLNLEVNPAGQFPPFTVNDFFLLLPFYRLLFLLPLPSASSSPPSLLLSLLLLLLLL